jgi:probable rRNA maturation factor
MPHHTELIIEDPRWNDYADLLQGAVTNSITTCLSHAPILYDDVPTDCTLNLNIVFSNDAAIKQLNADFRSKDAPTNVLSFAHFDDPMPLSDDEEEIEFGDIILSFDTIGREAIEQSKSFDHHLIHMVVHGCLHVMGYDHMNDDEAEIMENHEIQILSLYHIENPYDSE